MRKFDPWLVFFKREGARNWPFIAGFAITDALITNFTAGLTDSKNSRFVQEHNRRSSILRSAFKNVIFSGGLSSEPEISSDSSQKSTELQGNGPPVRAKLSSACSTDSKKYSLLRTSPKGI